MREVEFIEDESEVTTVNFKDIYKLEDLIQGTDHDSFAIRPSKLLKGKKEIVFETVVGRDDYAIYVGCNSDEFEPEIVMDTEGAYNLIFKKANQ